MTAAENPNEHPEGQECSEDANSPTTAEFRVIVDVVVFSFVAAVAAPLMWTALWFFGFYLAEPSPDGEIVLTEYEKFDILYGYLPWTFMISAFVTPVVFFWKQLATAQHPTAQGK